MALPIRLRACGPFMALVLCSCTLINNMNPRHKEAQQHAQEIQQLQLTVMRFADEYVGRTRAAIDDFQGAAMALESASA